MSSTLLRRALMAAAALPVLQLAPLGAPAAAAATTTCPTTLSFATPVACAIDATGETDAFGLSATAGDAVWLHAVGAAGSGLDVDLELQGPSGTVCAARAGASTDVVCRIPSTARYTVAVFDSGGDETGRYRLEAQRVNRPVGAVAMAMGQPHHGVVPSVGDNDWFTFAGAAGKVVVARAAQIGAGTLEADLDVYAPNGDVVCATRAGAVAQVACPLPATATYSMRVGDGSDDETGRYAVTVRPECTITGTTGADTITGTAGNDVICALGGADKVVGGDGDDIILGGTADDSLDGGAGSDVFLSDRVADGADVVIGGTGTGDVLSYAERGAAVTVDGDGQADDGDAGEADNVRADVETLIGGVAADRLVGGAANNTLVGGPGDDRLEGLGGDDTFVANLDADGADTFVGGIGRDHVNWAARSLPVTGDPDGVADDGGAGEGDNVGADVEALSGGSGADILTGGPGPDALYGGGGDDAIDGGLGDDRLIGEAGADRFAARVGDGADVISGGTSVDSLSYAVRTGAVTVNPDGLANDGEANERDDVRADVEHVIGGAGADTIIGSAAANHFDGRGGDDTLRGAAGDDTLLGGAGYDTLDGGDGADRCDPGADGGRVDYCDRV